MIISSIMKTESVDAARRKSDSCKVQVDKLQEENIELKNRMCEVLSCTVNPVLLVSFEEFQNKFIREDEELKLVRHLIHELDNMLLATNGHGGKMNGSVSRKIAQVNENTRAASLHHSELKKDFSRFLQTHQCC